MKNREELVLKKRLWRYKNPDKVHEENQRAKKRIKEWYLRNLDKKKEYDKRRRNEIRFGGNYYVTLERDGYKCVKCGSTENIVVHHIDGIGRGSSKPDNDTQNLQTLCQSCHVRHHLDIRYGKTRT